MPAIVMDILLIAVVALVIAMAVAWAVNNIDFVENLVGG